MKQINEDFLQQLAVSIRNHKPLPAFPSALSLDEAYEGVTSVAGRVCDEMIGGIKAGVTNPQLQEFFGLTQPLLGYLHDWGRTRSGATIPYHQEGKIECEVAILLDKEGHPTALAPAIEFVRFDFSNPKDFTPANMVLCSLGADQFILGNEHPWNDSVLEAINDTVITLLKDESELLRTTPKESLGGPKNVTAWALREAKRRGFTVTSPTVLLGGTCGTAIPFEPGSYVADYGEFGKLEFVVDSAPE
ncbi:MAG: hypothetical protein AAF749_02585 [Pseudomonadota bacterium]